MNAADIINALTYALREIEIIAKGGDLGMTDWAEESEDARLNEIEHKVEQALREAEAAGVETEHNL